MACVRLHLGGLILAATVVVGGCSTLPWHATPYCAESVDTHRARIVVVGDLQRTGPVEVWRERNDMRRARLVRQMAADAPDAVVLLGDMVWWGASSEEWAYFDAVMRPVQDLHVPVFPVLGNHEYYGDDETAMEHVRRRFPDMCHDHYVRIVDSVAIVLLNTNFDEMSEREVRNERRWFAHMLRQLDADPAIMHVVVAGHHPPYTNSTVVTDDRILRRAFVPLFTRADKTALWLAGHAHTYERFMVDGKHFIVSGGGGGPRQEVRLASEGARHTDLYDGPTVRPLHYLILERRGVDLYCTMRPLDADAGRMSEYDVVVVASSSRPLTSKD